MDPRCFRSKEDSEMCDGAKIRIEPKRPNSSGEDRNGNFRSVEETKIRACAARDAIDSL
jgi:hypothetical protein